jgi:flagellar hook-associated protein FlgK
MQIDQVPSAFNSGSTGIKKAEQGVDEAAVQINRLNTEQQKVQDVKADNKEKIDVIEARPQADLSEEAVKLVVNEHLAKANTKTIKTADEMIGTLIDTKV